MERICRRLVTVGAGALVVLLLSGAWLTRYYRPSPQWSGPRRDPGGVVAIGAHRGAAAALLLVMGLLLGFRLVSNVRRAAPGALAVLGGLALVVTGRRLAWWQLGLRAVRAHIDARGMLFAAFDNTVRFVSVPGTLEMTPAAFRLQLGIHAVAIPLALAGLLLAQRAREIPTAPGT